MHVGGWVGFVSTIINGKSWCAIRLWSSHNIVCKVHTRRFDGDNGGRDGGGGEGCIAQKWKSTTLERVCGMWITPNTILYAQEWRDMWTALQLKSECQWSDCKSSVWRKSEIILRNVLLCSCFSFFAGIMKYILEIYFILYFKQLNIALYFL